MGQETRNGKWKKEEIMFFEDQMCQEEHLVKKQKTKTTYVS